MAYEWEENSGQISDASDVYIHRNQCCFGIYSPGPKESHLKSRNSIASQVKYKHYNQSVQNNNLSLDN